MEEQEIRFGQPERPEDESMTDYREPPEEIVDIAKNILENRHNYIYKKGVRILYQLYEKEMVYRGKVVPGRLYKLTEREKAACNQDYMFVVSEPFWEGLDTQKMKEAAIDWIFCFADINSEGGFKLAEPDFYGFYSNIQEYGMWQQSLQELHKRLQQMRLPFRKEEVS